MLQVLDRHAVPTLAILLTLACSMPATTEAQTTVPDVPSSHDEEAHGLFEAGSVAFRAGRFDAALDYFEQAYELSHRPELLFNIGQAHDRLRHDVEALDAFRRYRAALPNADGAEGLDARIAVLEAALAADETAAETVDHDENVREVADVGSEHGSGGDVTSEWWFWTLIGVVLVGAGVGIGVGVALSSDSVESPIPGTNGRVITALVSF